jgi:hypothetical protein
VLNALAALGTIDAVGVGSTSVVNTLYDRRLKHRMSKSRGAHGVPSTTARHDGRLDDSGAHRHFAQSVLIAGGMGRAGLRSARFHRAPMRARSDVMDRSGARAAPGRNRLLKAGSIEEAVTLAESRGAAMRCYSRRRARAGTCSATTRARRPVRRRGARVPMRASMASISLAGNARRKARRPKLLASYDPGLMYR